MRVKLLMDMDCCTRESNSGFQNNCLVLGEEEGKSIVWQSPFRCHLQGETKNLSAPVSRLCT